jgi:uncharacterized protein
MKCPSCPDAVLVLSERQGVEIDYCPTCRGVWLDRGELDKLIERAATMAPAAAEPASRGSQQRDFVDSDHHPGRYPQGRRKKSWLGEFFD